MSSILGQRIIGQAARDRFADTNSVYLTRVPDECRDRNDGSPRRNSIGNSTNNHRSSERGDESLLYSVRSLVLMMCVISVASCATQNLATATPAPEVSAEQLWREHDANVDRFDSERVGKWVRVTGIVRDVGGGRVELLVERHDFRPKVVLLHDLPREERAEAVKNAHYVATCEVSKRRVHELHFLENPIHLRQCRR